MKVPNRSRLRPGIEHVLPSQVLLDLENPVDAFGWDVPLVRLVVEKRRILAIVDDNVDLLAAIAARFDHEGAIRLIPARQEVGADAHPGLLRRPYAGSTFVDAGP